MNLVKLIESVLRGVLLIEPKVFGDHRGYFTETYNKVAYEKIGLDLNLVQDNQSFSAEAGTIRGALSEKSEGTDENCAGRHGGHFGRGGGHSTAITHLWSVVFRDSDRRQSPSTCHSPGMRPRVLHTRRQYDGDVQGG